MLLTNDYDISELVLCEKIVRLNTKQEIELTDQFHALEMAPPTEILLEQEMEKRWEKFRKQFDRENTSNQA